jgi:tetratricopeptide (TPR) repeat protein
MNRQGRITVFAIVALLLVLTAFCYYPITHHQFICVDDQQYISDNTHVTTGLSWPNIEWAFRTGYACNWHPLTWISHMADCSLFGLNPGGHHLTNLLLHSANTALLFLLLFRLTKSVWPSAFVAALFGLHPLHVESVAWAAERKDVLSGFFFLLTLLAYVSYVRSRNKTGPTRSDFHPAHVPQVSKPAVSQASSLHRPERGPNSASNSALHTSHSAMWYSLTLLLFALGLMSKPMLVTLPFLLLLLDFWPLLRFPSFSQLSTFNSQHSSTPQSHRASFASPSFVIRHFFCLLAEKAPFFLLAAADSVITYLVQDRGGATWSVQSLPVTARLANSIVAYLRYVETAFWPAKLTLFYPFDLHLPLVLVIGAAAFICAITVIAICAARRLPFLTVGWLWFLGTLVPVVGLVQVGSQSRADRYMYLPAIGLFIMFAWSLQWLAQRAPKFSFVYVSATAIALALCFATTSRLAGYWSDSEKLFKHAIAVMPGNYLAWNSYGKALDEMGHKKEALQAFEHSIAIQPNFPESQFNCGTVLMQLGSINEAVPHFQQALRCSASYDLALHSLGNAYFKLGDLQQAQDLLARAVKLDTDDAEIHHDLGTILLHMGRFPEAIHQLTIAVGLQPGHLEAQRNLGVALAQSGNIAEAAKHLHVAVELAPSDPEIRFNLGLSLLDLDRNTDAETELLAGEKLSPKDPRFPYRLAIACQRERKFADSIANYRKSISLAPEFAEGMNDLAWLLATCPDDRLRAGPEAVALAQKACSLTGRKNPAMLATESAAFAEVGRFKDAAVSAEQSRALALSANEQSLVVRADKLLKLCAASQPPRDL